MTSEVWTSLRPWRNSNPGDLRTLGQGQKWDGQIGIDNGPGGPFCKFALREKGWRALSLLLRNYQNLHGLTTMREICARFAPSVENNTSAYETTVCAHMGVGPTEVVDMNSVTTNGSACVGIAIAEGGSRIPWPQDEIDQGVKEANLA